MKAMESSNLKFGIVRNFLFKVIPRLATLVFLLLSSNVRADLTDIIFSNELEMAAATANQQSYQSLLALGCSDDSRGESETCSGATFVLFSNIRELVHTANALLGNEGSTQFSLDLDVDGLGKALRWTAGEEFSSQSSLTSDFVGGQLSNLSSRLKALRGGSRGFGIGFNSFGQSTELANNTNQIRGGGASADENNQYSRWGGFINGDFGYGDKAPTVFEDAYDFNGSKISLGADYRYTPNWVLGFIGGFVDQEIDFNSLLSTVDGGIKTDGFSLMPYVLYQTDDYYASFSLGLQKQAIDMTRYIKYPSLNPNVSSADTIAISSTDATIKSFFLELGYSFQQEAFLIEPFVSVANARTKIDAFSEIDINDDAFDLTVGKQKITSLEVSYGFKLQYSLTPNWGVVVPYFDVQSHHQQEKDARNISSSFSNLPAGDLNAVNFNLQTDPLDTSYYSYSIGMSFVIRGDTMVDEQGNSSGSMQAFINYKSIENIDNYSEKVITLGFRYGF